MAAAGSNILYEDIFETTDLNPEGKGLQFHNVSRVIGVGVTYEMDLIIDIQSELFPIKRGEKFTMALASTLDMQGNPDDGVYNQSGEPTLLDKYDYGMHGKIFRYEPVGDLRVAVYVSYGGLLMKLTGEQRYLSNLQLDSKIYCLIRKLEKNV